MKKRCAVCGDTTKLNVRLAWKRDSDGKEVNVCLACAEADKVNENSIDNFTTEDTLYKNDYTVAQSDLTKYHAKNLEYLKSGITNTRKRTFFNRNTSI